MERIRTTEVTAHIGQRIRVAGWLHSLRRLGGINFLLIRDGWGLIQAVAETEEEIAVLLPESVGTESIIVVEGVVNRETQAPGGVELHNLKIELLNPVSETPPISLNKRKLNAQPGTLLDHAVVTNRHPLRRATLRLSAGIIDRKSVV